MRLRDRTLAPRTLKRLQAALLPAILVAYAAVFILVLGRPPGALQASLAVAVILSGWWFGLAGGVAAPVAFFGVNLAISLALGRSPAEALADALSADLAAAAIVGPGAGYLRGERDRLRARAGEMAEEMLREREEARQVALAAERLRTLGALVAGVAHEVNNPLAYMRLNLEENDWVLARLADEPDVPPRVRRELRGLVERNGTVLEGVEQVARITRDLRRVAKSGGGERAPADVNDLVRTTSEAARSRFPQGVVPRHDLRAARRPAVDAAEMRQVLLNLLLNAADAAPPEGNVRIRTFDEGEHVVIEVEDEGPGIPPDVQAKLFTPFFTTKPQGAGLGLSISRRIVQEHGGTLTFTTAPGKGTLFRVRLPAAGP